ncbi:capsule assembly Wzi family protein [Salinimicrobium flavum]|uniref:Capsule assembly Wzi family protein n=1 Tax=Salinimicrobium flavum TaxID=1737065 RepID=A0ABW5ISZ0_9FLAO
MTIKKLSISSCFMLLIFFDTHTASAQTTYSAELELTTQGGTQEELPFWMYSNQRGRISPETNVLGLAAVKMQHQLRGEAVIEIGAGGVIHDGFDEKWDLDEAYIQFRNQHFYITGGVKQKKELYNGLSATNENILWSLNARPLPGVEIGTVKPFFVFPGIGFEGRWGEYLLEEDRHVPWARVHHKKFNIVLQPSETWQIKAGIQHFAQWGGVSPDRGPQPEGLTDYLRIVAGRAGDKKALEGDQANVLGNHLGSWILELIKEYENFNTGFIFNNLFEDGSGSRFANFPDGRYGLYYKSKENAKIINSIMYEFFYTKDQSQTGPHLYDNYFNNSVTYNSGWTFHKKVIGVPFFTFDTALGRIINNKFTAHHLGVAGDFGNFYQPLPYRFLVSYRHNEGTYSFDLIPADKEPKIVSTYFTTRLYNGEFDYDNPRLTLDFLFAADFHNLLDSNFGAGVSLKYSIE